jgi:Bacterial regulatory helix-turn-helix protein, lysR family
MGLSQWKWAACWEAPRRLGNRDLNLLTALRALLTERNVTRAGESLHVSPSAVSGMLARLREYVDDQLVVPVGRRLELTPLAETLVDPINDLMMRLGFDAPRLVETLQWHRYRDLDPGSQWLREKIISHAQALPALDQLVI